MPDLKDGSCILKRYQSGRKKREGNEVETDGITEMDTTEIKEAEVRQALKKTKSGRTTSIDGILAELYKADSDVAINELTRLFNRIWHEEKLPA